MSATVTIESIQAEFAKLGALIEQLKAQAATATVLEIPAATISLRPGERYAGAILDDDGKHLYHLILMAPRPSKELNWEDAMDWAEENGGSLPNRREWALLFAQCRGHIDAKWHWSSEPSESDASYAWYCYFLGGDQTINRKSSGGCAVAVRRA